MTPDELADGYVDTIYRTHVAHGRVRAAEMIADLIRTAVKERDMEWWAACALVDNVDPTPEAVKAWLAIEQQYHVEQAVTAERERWQIALGELVKVIKENTGAQEAHAPTDRGPSAPGADGAAEA